MLSAPGGGIPKGDTLACPPLVCFFFCHFFLHKQKEMARNLSGIYNHRHCEPSPAMVWQSVTPLRADTEVRPYGGLPTMVW